MQGVEKSHCDATIEAVLAAYYGLMDSTVEEALKPVLAYGKSDTLGVDANPEINIIGPLQRYDKYSVVITEETGDNDSYHFLDSADPRRFPTVFICDPTDRSAQIKQLFEGYEDKRRPVREVIRDDATLKRWEDQFGAPATITGASSAVTCIRRGVPVFAVIANYITQQLFLSSSAGNFVLALPADRKLAGTINTYHVLLHGEQIYFRDLDSTDVRRFVTFMGKAGYKENLTESRLVGDGDVEKFLHYPFPGGPLRILYLSDLQPAERQIGFILSNGEKIGEWIHWLPFIRFAKKENDQGEPALRLFEVCQDRPWTKEGILMSTTPPYSIFKSMGESDQRLVVDVGRFSSFQNPSKIRSTLIVTPYENDWATRVVKQYGYRPIELYSE